MAFPGEHYHNLLTNLASEIYHNRYPVEHGVDILHGVMRDAGPEALQVQFVDGVSPGARALPLGGRIRVWAEDGVTA